MDLKNSKKNQVTYDKTQQLEAQSKVFLFLPALFLILVLTSLGSTAVTLNSPANGSIVYFTPVIFNITSDLADNFNLSLYV